MNHRIWIVALLTGVVGFLLGLVAIRSESGAPSDGRLLSMQAPPLVVHTAPAALDAPLEPAVDFSGIAAKVNAAVVNVDAASRSESTARSTASRWRRDLLDDPSVPREGTGSGFVIDASGFILTNFHVIDGADRVTVTLGNGRALRADIAGVDPALDVALLKVTSPQPLPVAVLGDSDALQAGQWVCAIGNPLGYVHSVTVGVVSFVGRKLFDQTLDAFIQTDAAISLGNSGGPLIDRSGRVVGMTSAVSSQAASIGFAIPIGQIVAVLPQLRDRGRVARGYAGIGVTAVTPALQEALHLGTSRGALVQNIAPESPAERAGLRLYDVAVGVDGRPVTSDEDVIRLISAGTPGTAMRLDIVRDSGRQEVVVKLVERPLPTSIATRLRRADARRASGSEFGALGFKVADLDPSSPLRRSLPSTVTGVAVVDVDPAGPARLVRLRPGQVVLELNRRPTPNAAAFHAALAGLPESTAAALLVYDPIADQRVLIAVEPDR
jgi:serine protease Do